MRRSRLSSGEDKREAEDKEQLEVSTFSVFPSICPEGKKGVLRHTASHTPCSDLTLTPQNAVSSGIQMPYVIQSALN